MALSVLNDTQRRAVEYVLQRSEEDSLRAFPSLLRRVKKLGYEKEDLERLLSNTVHRKILVWEKLANLANRKLFIKVLHT